MGSRDRLRGPAWKLSGSLYCLVLSEPYFKHSDTKWDFKKHSRSNFRGGVRLMRPLLIRHCTKICRYYELKKKKEKEKRATTLCTLYLSRVLSKELRPDKSYPGWPQNGTAHFPQYVDANCDLYHCSGAGRLWANKSMGGGGKMTLITNNGFPPPNVLSPQSLPAPLDISVWGNLSWEKWS